MTRPRHIIFFDADCPICQKSASHLAQIDQKHSFSFAPLKGQTARGVFTGPQEKYLHFDSLILVENYQSTEREFWVLARAIFRIYWIIGGVWSVLGLLSFVPGWLGTDYLYRKFADARMYFKVKPPEFPIPPHRLLP